MSIENAQQAGQESSTERSPQDVVKAFISALERLDLDGAVALAADDIRRINAPLKTSSDRRGFEKALRAMFKDATRFEVQYLDIHERGDGIVYTDRVDIFEGGGVRMELPVQGEFRVRDGLVTEWIDRFSWLKLIGDIVRSLPDIARYRLRK